MDRANHIAVIESSDHTKPQALLSAAVVRLRGEGVRVVGVLAEDNDVEGACSAGFLRDIVTGRRFSIQLATAPVGTKCHLDAFGIESACELLLPQLATADLVVLSKFGKLEAMGQGLWRAFASATSSGTPLLTTVSSRHGDAWNAWAPAMTRLEANVAAIEQWWMALNPAASDHRRASLSAFRPAARSSADQ